MYHYNLLDKKDKCAARSVPATKPQSILAILVASLFCLLTPQTLFAYTPFSPVKNVCPICVDKSLDIIKLKDGSTINAKVVGGNSDYYVLYQYGEYRPIENSAIESIQWASGTKPDALSKTTQIELNNGLVFSGAIKTDNEKPAYIILNLPEMGKDIVIFKDQIKKQYVSGYNIR